MNLFVTYSRDFLRVHPNPTADEMSLFHTDELNAFIGCWKNAYLVDINTCLRRYYTLMLDLPNLFSYITTHLLENTGDDPNHDRAKAIMLIVYGQCNNDRRLYEKLYSLDYYKTKKYLWYIQEDLHSEFKESARELYRNEQDRLEYFLK